MTININDDKMINGYTILFLYEIMLPYMNYTYTYEAINMPISFGWRSFRLTATVNRFTIKVHIGYRILLRLFDCCEFGWLRLCDGPETFKCIQVESVDTRQYEFDYFAILIEMYLNTYYFPMVHFAYGTINVTNTNVSSGSSFFVRSQNNSIMHNAFTLTVNVPVKIAFDIRTFEGMTGNNCIYGGKC